MGVANHNIYGAAVAADAPNAWWRFDNVGGKSHLEDTSGHGGTLTFTAGNEPTEVATPLVGQNPDARARDFEASSTQSYRTIGTGDVDLDLGDVLTIEAWLKVESLPGAGAKLTVVDKSATAYHVYVKDDGKVALAKKGTAEIVASTVALSTGQWYHVVITKSGATVKIYIDAVDRTGTVTNQTLANAATNLQVGRNSSAAEYWDGAIAELALYPTALSSTRVSAHHTAGTTDYWAETEFMQIASLPTYFPKLWLGIAFAGGPKDEAPVWTKLTDRLRSFSLSRGRSKEDVQVDTGTLETELSNHDRALEAEYDGSPYWPNVKKTKQILLCAYWNGVVYDLFRGTISDWGPDWPSLGLDSVARVKAHDYQKLANLQDLTGALSQQATGARIHAGLDALGVPAGMRVIDDGIPDVVAEANTEGFNLLAHLQDVAKADPGILFIDSSGRWTFQDRNHRADSETLTRATFGDAPGELGYTGMRPRDDDADLWNDIRVTVAGTGNVRTATDSTSITDHGKRSKSESLKLVTDAQGDGVAGAWLALYKDGRRRIPEIDCEGASDPALLWPVILGAEISWHATTLRRPVDDEGEIVGDPILIEQHIEGIKMSAGRANWKTSFNLSPADTQEYWELGTAGKSELGETTWLYI